MDSPINYEKKVLDNLENESQIFFEKIKILIKEKNNLSKVLDINILKNNIKNVRLLNDNIDNLIIQMKNIRHNININENINDIKTWDNENKISKDYLNLLFLIFHYNQ